MPGWPSSMDANDDVQDQAAAPQGIGSFGLIEPQHLPGSIVSREYSIVTDSPEEMWGDWFEAHQGKAAGGSHESQSPARVSATRPPLSILPSIRGSQISALLWINS